LVSVEWQVERYEITVAASSYEKRILPRRALEPTLYKDGHRTIDLKDQEIGLTRNLPSLGSLGGFFGVGSQPPNTIGGDVGLASIESPVSGGLPDALSDDYTLSSSAERAREFLSKKIGKDLKLKSVPLLEDFGITAYYIPVGPGGSKDPTTRAIYARPDLSYPVLFHETGHAADPALADRNLTLDQEYIKGLRSPSSRLDYLFQQTGKPKVKSETEAQSFVGRQLPAFQRENPDLNVKSQGFFDAPYFKEYPASYATKSIDDFYNAELGQMQNQFVTEEDADRGVAMRVFERAPETSLKYALDRDLASKESEIKDFTRAYVDARLNQFQTKPTEPEPGYFAQ
jgi:hypothetical protein